jgi:UDP:flavonoid glycosyltransferase YjiC (YdhE family)
MAHIAIISKDLAGHLFPLGGMAAELRRRGHEVTMVSRDRAGTVCEQLGLPYRQIDFEWIPARRLSPARIAVGKAFGVKWFFDLQHRLSRESEAFLRKAPAILQEIGADGVVVDQDIVAGSSVAQRLGLPFVTACPALMWHEEPSVPPHYIGWSPTRGMRSRLRNRIGYQAWQFHMSVPFKVVNRFRAEWGLPKIRRFGGDHSNLAHLVQGCSELDFPRSSLSPVCHYVGSLGAGRPSTHPFPWDRLDGRPLIFASLGTLPGGSYQFTAFRKMADACAGLDAQLVIALGKWSDTWAGYKDPLNDLPGDPIVVEFAPQLELLKRASLLITHSGLNTTLEALLHGVPMVMMPRNADQPGVAARTEWAGAGLRTQYRLFTPTELRGKLERVLNEPSFREHAKRLGAALQATGGPAHAAEIIEQAILSRKPVLRQPLGV